MVVIVVSDLKIGRYFEVKGILILNTFFTNFNNPPSKSVPWEYSFLLTSIIPTHGGPIQFTQHSSTVTIPETSVN